MPRAPKICNEKGCSTLIHEPGMRRCPDHYEPWKGSHGRGFDAERSDTEAHRMLHARVFGRAGWHCEIRYVDICTGSADELDCRTPLSEGGVYSDANCQAACIPCHRRKSSLEGHRARGHDV